MNPEHNYCVNHYLHRSSLGLLCRLRAVSITRPLVSFSKVGIILGVNIQGLT